MNILLDDMICEKLAKVAQLSSLSPSALVNKILATHLDDSDSELESKTFSSSGAFVGALHEARENRDSYYAQIDAVAREKEDRFIRSRKVLEQVVRPLLVKAEDLIEEMETRVDLSGVLYRETFSGQGHLHLVFKTRCLHSDRVAKLKFIASPTSERLAARSSGRDGARRILKTSFDDESLHDKVEEVVRHFIVNTV